MSDTVGNVTRHRRVPVVIKDGGSYRIVYAPAISGESLAHAIQRNLITVARGIYGNELPVDEWSLRGEFVKFGDQGHLTETLKTIVSKVSEGRGKGKGRSKESVTQTQHEFEAAAIRESIVADIGGFLYAENPPVRRTSPLMVGYAVPVEDAIEVTAIESQVHARQVPVGIIKKDEERQAQMLYYVEVASAVYGVTIGLDIDAIGRTSMVKVEDVVTADERLSRIKAAVGAIALTLGQGIFGAKRTRFSPILEVINAVAVVSHPVPFNVSPPQRKGYIDETLSRVKVFKEFMSKIEVNAEASVGVYGFETSDTSIARHESLESLFMWILEKIGSGD